MSHSRAAAAHGRADWMVPELGLEAEIERLRVELGRWIEGCLPEMRDALGWQFLSGSKYFRPLTIFSCHRALHPGEIPAETFRAAMALEMFHNMTLVVDDILDRSDERRGKPTMHTQFGELQALMTSGYMVAEGYRLMQDDQVAVALLSELMARLGAAEVKQWNERRHPAGVADWQAIAREDTGAMFEVAACLGDRSERLRQFGQLLGILYHGCDDVSDVRGTTALGGGGDEDIRDGILTLPAAIATMKDERVAAMFRDPRPENYDDLAAAFRAALPEAEAKLDDIARQARAAVDRHARRPELLHVLIDQTRALSRK